MKSSEFVPLDGRPGRPCIESGGQVIDRVGFSRPSGHEPKGGETSKLGLQGRSSFPSISACSGVVVVIVLFPRRGMALRDSIVPVVTSLLARWWFAICPVRYELAVAFIISRSPGGVMASVRE